MKELMFDLPMPPSVWKLYQGHGKNRRKSKEYKAWIGEAGWMLIQQRNRAKRHKKMTGKIEVIIRAYRDGNKGRDLDNILKSLLDLLTVTGTIEDDSQVVSINAQWVNSGVPCTMTVREV